MLLETQIAALVGILLLLGAFAVAHTRFPSDFSALWLAGWTFYAIRFFFDIIVTLTGPTYLLKIAAHQTIAASAILLLLAVTRLSERRESSVSLALVIWAVLTVWIVVSPLVIDGFMLRHAPLFFAFGAIQLYTAYLFYDYLRQYDYASTPLIVGSLIIWGLHKFDYPFLRPVEWVAPYGYVLSAVLSFLLGLGVLMFLLEDAERKARDERAEAKRKSREYRDLFENLTDPVFIHDTEGRFRAVNETAAAVLGYSKDEFRSMTVTDVDAPEQHQSIPGYVNEIQETGSATFRSVHVTADGEHIPVQVHSATIQYQGEESILSVARDISQQVAREEALEHQTETLRVVREVNRRIVRATDPEATLTDAAEIVHSHPSFEGTFLALLDDEQVNFVCEGGSQLTRTQVEEIHSDAYITDVLDQEILRIEDTTAPPYQQHFADEPAHPGVALPIRYESTAYGVLTIHFPPEEPPTDEELDLLEEVCGDIGFALHSLELKAERERLARELRQSVKQLQVIDRVLRHNLRNDMNVIKGLAETIQEASEGDVAERAATIVAESDQLLTTADKERKITKVLADSNPPKPIDIGAIIDHTVADLQERHPEARVTVEGTTDHSVKVIGSIGQALDELLNNAVIHSDRAEPSIEVIVEDSDDSVAVRIADDGPGIPDMEREVLMEEAEIDPLYHGSGLGLWLVKMIVRQSGGSLAFDENEPRGSIITIRLPKEGAGNYTDKPAE